MARQFSAVFIDVSVPPITRSADNYCKRAAAARLHNELRPIHFITTEASLPRLSACRLSQSLQNCNVWQDKFLGRPTVSRTGGAVFKALACAAGRVRHRATPRDSECLLASVNREIRTLSRCRYWLRNYKGRCGLWGVAFGIPPFTPKADVHDCRIGGQVRNSPQVRISLRGQYWRNACCEGSPAIQRQPNFPLASRQIHVRKR